MSHASDDLLIEEAKTRKLTKRIDLLEIDSVKQQMSIELLQQTVQDLIDLIKHHSMEYGL
jgi:hypothetical protein